MKIHFELGDIIIDYEHRPMPEGRFRALCSLVLAAIAGGVLVALAHMVGVWAIAWVVGALVAYGFYKIIQSA